MHDHFNTFYEDQFDFHSYCMRKSTIRAYMGMIEMVDDQHNLPRYRKASRGAVRAYCALYDEETAAEADAEAAKNGGEETEAMRIVAARREAASEAKVEEQKLKAKGGDDPSQGGRSRKAKDIDPVGALFIQKAMEKDGKGAAGLLDAAWVLVEDLRKNDPSDVEAACLAFDTAERMKKPMLQLRACKDLQKYATTPTEKSKTALRVARLAVSAATAEGPMKALLEKQANLLLGGASNVQSFVSTFLSGAGDSNEARVSAAEVVSQLPGEARPDDWKQTAAGLLSGVVFATGTAAALCLATRMMDVLKNLGEGGEVSFAADMRKVFPLATCFGAEPPAVLAVSGDTFFADGRVELNEEHSKQKAKQEAE